MQMNWKVDDVIEPAPVAKSASATRSPNTKHSHKRDLFRVVISGSITTDTGAKLSSGDRMFVPAGTEYGYTAASNPGAFLLHFYD
jgi:quercetin dioxygenase-like cupin family protein